MQFDITKKHTNALSIAMHQASLVDDMQFKLGCVVLGGGKIVSQGHNKPRRSALTGVCSLHAEMDALSCVLSPFAKRGQPKVAKVA